MKLSLLSCILYVLIAAVHGFLLRGKPPKVRPPTRIASVDMDCVKPYLIDSKTAERTAILTVYFVQGALGLSTLARTFFFKDQLGLSPAESAAIAGAATLPWAIKPLYGFLSDSVPLLGYKRRSYLVLSGISGSLSWMAMSLIVHDGASALAATLVGSATVAVADVVVDSIVVERTREANEEDSGVNTAGDLQSLCWGAASVGGVLAAAFSGSLLQSTSPSAVFQITAIFPLIIAISSFAIEEKKVVENVDKSDLLVEFQSQFSQLKDTFLNPKIYLPVLFVFLWRATPTADSASFYFAVNDLGFKPDFLGKAQLAGSLASLAGILLYRWKLQSFSYKTLIFWSTVKQQYIIHR